MPGRIAVRLEIGSCRAVSLPSSFWLRRPKILFDVLLSLGDNLRRYGKLGMA